MTIRDITDFEFAGYANLFRLKAAWWGDQPPINAEIINFDGAVNARLDPRLHGTFDVVWLFEREIFSASNWELILDESIRLIRQSGYLVVRYNERQDRTGFYLKSLIGRNPLLSVRLCYQENYSQTEKVFILKIRRKMFDLYEKKDWTIGILYNGSRKENVNKLIRSIKQAKPPLLNIEIIIAGPEFDLCEDDRKFDIRFIQIEDSERLARITEKKNAICNIAKYNNIAIFHDRYIVNQNFFKGFEKYGYDFDFITVAQQYEDGGFFPGYAALDERKLVWQQPQFERTCNRIYDGQYINGGLTIVKKHLLEVCQLYNGLLLWAEAEDVELSFYLRQLGIIPRINIYSAATTIGVSKNYTGTFKDLTGCTTYKQPKKRLFNLALVLWFKLPFGIKQRIRSTRIFYVVKKLLLRY